MIVLILSGQKERQAVITFSFIGFDRFDGRRESKVSLAPEPLLGAVNHPDVIAVNAQDATDVAQTFVVRRPDDLDNLPRRAPPLDVFLQPLLGRLDDFGRDLHLLPPEDAAASAP